MIAFRIVCFTCLVLYVSTEEASQTTQDTKPEEECDAYQDSCESCVKHSSCLWCKSNDEGEKCVGYPNNSLLPKEETCPLEDARFRTCWVNYKALLISVGVIGGAIALIITCCCVYCCCCRNKKFNRRRYEREMDRTERDQEERRIKSEERRAEREQKYAEIRKKYGITKDDGYKRFDNE